MGRLCPRFVLASVVQLEYLPPVSQSSYRPRVGRSVRVPPSRQSVSTSLVCQGASVLASSSCRSLSCSTSLPSVSLSGRLCIVLASVAQLERFEYLPRLSGRLCPRFVLASVAQLERLEYLPRLSGAPLSSLRPRVGRSVGAVGVPPSSVRAPLSSRRSLNWNTSLPSVSPRIVLASFAQLKYLPPVRSGACVSSSHRSLSSTSLVCQGASVLASSSRRSLSWSWVPPCSQSVCQGASVSSSHWSLSCSTSLVCQGAPLSSLRPRIGRTVGVRPSRQSVCRSEFAGTCTCICVYNV